MTVRPFDSREDQGLSGLQQQILGPRRPEPQDRGETSSIACARRCLDQKGVKAMLGEVDPRRRGVSHSAILRH
ncbi:hypothetical protein THIOKS12790025 [Thiocapsa sp. KS1]|nr:hypothetical protein THIOKS12790025 [Thiocapsa sp. KS1]